jgi:signal transduction histidine kinase
VLFETRGEIARRLFGLPPGFWMGALGSLIGIAAILAIMREARPLRELSAAVARFAGEAKPFAVRARGAPEIRNLITAVNDMQARIAALVKGRTVLIGAVSHDMKTYITRLRMRAEMLVEDGQRERAVRDLEDMTTLIDDALAVVRGSAVSDRHEMLDLVPLIQADAADRPQGVLEIVRPEATPLLVNGDAAALRRLFGNLIDNALRFGRTCRVAVTRHGDFAAVLVDDDGPGIPPSERLAVFEPFYRLEPSRSRTTGGSGLGLAIAKQIVETHGGSIAVEASPLKGARLRVEIPAAEDRHRAVKVRPTQ